VDESGANASPTLRRASRLIAAGHTSGIPASLERTVNEPSDAVGRDGYPFTQPEGLLAHYTEAPIAFEHILPGKLRLSPYRSMRDPAENKDVLPNIRSRRPKPEDEHAIDEVYALLREARDRMRVLSLTRHAKDWVDSYPSFDYCWSRPRMWEQYGDKHHGACLLFDRTRLERAICTQRPDERTRYFRNVDYEREASVEVFRRELDADDILRNQEPVRAITDHIHTHQDAFFFLKSDDFETEHEYRAVLTAGDDDRDEYTYIDYGDALLGVVLGERFPECQDPGAVRECEHAGVKLGWIAWRNGRPRVFPRRPARLSA
jgi:hypothetical protein